MQRGSSRWPVEHSRPTPVNARCANLVLSLLELLFLMFSYPPRSCPGWMERLSVETPLTAPAISRIITYAQCFRWRLVRLVPTVSLRARNLAWFGA